MIGVRKVSSNDAKDWDEYVERHPGSTPYHLFAWGQSVEESYGHAYQYYVAEQDGKIVGVLPLIKMTVPMLGGNYCSLPFCDLGGVLADTDSVHQTLIEHLKSILKSENVTKADLRHTDLEPEDELEAGEKVRMLLPLEASAEEQFKQFKSKLRSQVRKAEKNGVSFCEGNTQLERDAFYKVMQVNMHQLGSPVHSKKWFNSVLDLYGEKAKLGLVKYGEEVVGGAIILLSGNKVTVPWASTLPQYNNLSPNMLLYWGLLSIAAEGGYSFFDFGRSTVGEGTYKFKSQWGAKPVRLRWQAFDANGLLPVSESVASAGGLRAKVEHVWRKLPPQLVNFLGPILRRYISL